MEHTPVYPGWYSGLAGTWTQAACVQSPCSKTMYYAASQVWGIALPLKSLQSGSKIGTHWGSNQIQMLSFLNSDGFRNKVAQSKWTESSENGKDQCSQMFCSKPTGLEGSETHSN